MKTCTKCKIEKEFSEFYKKINRGEGLAGYSSICKSCLRKTNREYVKSCLRKTNKECGDLFNKKEYNKFYREKNKDRLNEYTKQWRIENKEKMKNQRKIYYQEIPISSAETEEDVYKLNHYTNFQPLYWLDNIKKSNKIE